MLITGFEVFLTFLRRSCFVDLSAKLVRRARGDHRRAQPRQMAPTGAGSPNSHGERNGRRRAFHRSEGGVAAHSYAAVSSQLRKSSQTPSQALPQDRFAPTCLNASFKRNLTSLQATHQRSRERRQQRGGSSGHNSLSRLRPGRPQNGATGITTTNEIDHRLASSR